MDNIEYLKDLSSGATVSQSAKLYKTQDIIDYNASCELSYVDIVNLTLALNILSEFYDVYASVLVKNNSLSGAALGVTTFDSFKKAIDCSPVDSICGVAAFSKSVDAETAKILTPDHLIVSPDFDKEALNYFELKSIRYVKLNTSLKNYKNYLTEEVFVSPFGTVIQNKNKTELDKDTFKVVSKTKPDIEKIEDAILAWKITKHIKSTSVVIAKDFKTLGISQGQQSGAVEYALSKSCDNAKDAVMASDIPLTVHDLNAAIQNRISLVIQSGVAPDVLRQADKFNIAMITTGISNYSLI